MNLKKIYRALEEAISDTAEHLFFQELEDVKKVPPEKSLLQGDFHVTVKILKPFKGSLDLFYEHQFADQLVTEMLGDFVKDEQQIIDGLNELSNTIAGKLMANCVQDKQFKISLPECRKVTTSQSLPVDYIYNFYFDETKIGAFFQAE